MLIDSVIIKLKRKGMGQYPDYSIKILGNGRIFYEEEKIGGINSKENVIDKSKITELISEFKKYNFLNFDNNYVNPSKKEPYNTISISLPGKDTEMITRDVSFYENLDDTPLGLKKICESIKDFSGFKKDIEILDNKNSNTINNKNSNNKSFSYNKKLIGVVSIAIIVLFIGFLIFQSGMLDSKTEPTNEDDSIEYPAINLLITSDQDNIAGCNDIPSLVSDFYGGELVYIYYNLTDISHDNNIKFYETIAIYNESFQLINKNYVELEDVDEEYSTNMCRYLNFSTIYPNSLSVGDYKINITINDIIVNYNFSKTVDFKIIDILPKITVLEPASIVRAYHDYDAKDEFLPGDDVEFYQEYKDIDFIGDSCDIYLELRVFNPDGVEVYFNSDNKTVVGNNAQRWWLTEKPDDTWVKGTYTVYAYIRDNSSGLSNYKNSSFILN